MPAHLPATCLILLVLANLLCVQLYPVLQLICDVGLPPPINVHHIHACIEGAGSGTHVLPLDGRVVEVHIIGIRVLCGQKQFKSLLYQTAHRKFFSGIFHAVKICLTQSGVIGCLYTQVKSP